MNVLFIGYKNHSRRLLSLLCLNPDIAKISVHHPNFSKLESSDIRTLSNKIQLTPSLDEPEVSAAFITSPTDTHFDYIKKLLRRNIYIYCEKPPVHQLSELAALRALDEISKKKIYFNYNYRFTALAEFLRSALKTKALGKPVHFNFVSTQGIAFKEGFKNDWRLKAKSNGLGVFANVGIHYIDLCQWIFGRGPRLSVRTSKHSPNTETYDTASIELQFPQVTVNILVSYAAPFMNSARLLFENALLELNDGHLKVYSPRDSFDAQGRFITPPVNELPGQTNSLEYYNESLKKSLRFFTETVKNNQSFLLEEFDLSLLSNELVLDEKNLQI